MSVRMTAYLPVVPCSTIDPLARTRADLATFSVAQRRVGKVFLDDPDWSIDKIAAAQRVECYSVGSTSTFLANDAQARFSRLGITSNAYYDAHIQLISAAALSSRDVVLAISHIGRMPTLLEAVDVAREQGATIIGITQPDTPLAKRCTIPISMKVPDDAAVRVGTEAYLAGQVLIEVLMVGIGLRLGEAAIDRLKHIHTVLLERGVDTEVHPALKWGWSRAERDAANRE